MARDAGPPGAHAHHHHHHDRLGLVYLIFVLLGIGTLLPWNVLLTEKEFFDVRLQVAPSDPRIADNFMSLFGLVFNFANLLAFCVTVALPVGRLSLHAQVLHPLLVIGLLLAGMGALALRVDLSGNAVAVLTLPTLALLGVCMAVLQGGVLNMAVLFPPVYIQGFVVGAGLSGVGTSLLAFATQLRAQDGSGDGGDSGGGARLPAEVAPAAFAYFASAAAVALLCALAFCLLGRLLFSRARLAAHYAAAHPRREQARGCLPVACVPGSDDDLAEPLLIAAKEEEEECGREEEEDGAAREGGGRADPEPQPAASGAGAEAAPLQAQASWGSGAGGRGGGGAGGSDSDGDDVVLLVDSGSTGPRGRPNGGVKGPAAAPRSAAPAAMVADAAPADGAKQPGEAGSGSTLPFIVYAASIFLCLAGSLAVWPGVGAYVCSANNPAAVSPCAPRAEPYGRLSGDLFVPCLFLLFALGDVSGRVASSLGPWARAPPPPAALAAYAVARLAVAAALPLCHVVTPSRWLLPYMLRSDAWPLGLALALGLTQGHLLSTACMHAPSLLPSAKHSRFGAVTGLAIAAGCLAGSLASTALVDAFTGRAPS